MNLLPKSHQEFGSQSYWEKFFAKRGSRAFEWYGEYTELCGILHKYIKPTDRILMVGCGNSNLSADMYDVGYRNIVNIDISETAIKQMRDKNAEKRPDMEFITMDMTQTTFADKEFSVVLDKGTLDAVLTDESSHVLQLVDKMLTEISRLLRVGGRYVCVTLAQEHILRKLLNFFPSQGWPVRICRVHQHEGESEFHMPVFVCVFTHFNKMPNMKQILEVSNFEEKCERRDTTDELMAAVKEMQHYGILRHQLNKKASLEEQVSIDLVSGDMSEPRYTINIVDSPRNMTNKYAVFIVPLGRETEWLFSCDAGRRELSVSAGHQRLAVVTLHRQHTYTDLDAIKAELSTKVFELAPPGLGNAQVPFLSLGDDVKACVSSHRGRSEVNGDYVVEDVDVDGQMFRRLVFTRSSNIIQSEARLIKVPSSKSKKKKSDAKLEVDVNYLSLGYHVNLVAGLAFLEDFHNTMEGGVKLLLVGLGGGGLSLYIHNNLVKVHQEVVEIDESLLNIAKTWFGFVEDDRMKVTIGDGVKVIKEKVRDGVKYDVVIIDVDSKDPGVGMSGPPQEFISGEFTQTLSQLLHSRGVLMYNLVCRNQELRTDFINQLKSTFKEVYIKKVTEDLNECVYCLPSHRLTSLKEALSDNKLPKTVTSAVKVLQQVLEIGGRVRARDLPQLSSLLQDLIVA